ncbi:MAG TPA: hypothetical protein PKE35_01150 [Anaerolineales bacterium]|nr:hypothetical protein [Anaerolineales bacterium]HMV94841.1 hypothetical protein [Anaerolineales bacterium]HMX17857.1 hypothetical protein [Anaerolineales bacterium]HMX72823.1 hypothetical protein [Anaerolineales bacterium]HMZ43888.1 hypothetical protein [Anaerolineales bacterium]
MSISLVLEVAVGLIVIYYILGSVVSLITQWINEFFESRGRALEQYLIKLVGDKKIGDLKNLPQLQSLRPIRFKGPLSVFGSVTEPKMIEKIPVATLVDAYFDLAGLTAKKEMELLELAELVDRLPDSEGKQAFITWINQGVTSIAELRVRATSYFTGILEQAAATFRARARSFVIILSIGITILFGTDTIQLARNLWTNAELRAIAAAQANAVVAREGASADLSDLIDDLSQYSIKIGWWQTQQFPEGNNVGDWALFIFLKVLGLGVTAAAVSQGSSFWYDLLKKLTSPTSSSSGSKSSPSGGSSSG